MKAIAGFEILPILKFCLLQEKDDENSVIKILLSVSSSPVELILVAAVTAVSMIIYVFVIK